MLNALVNWIIEHFSSGTAENEVSGFSCASEGILCGFQVRYMPLQLIKEMSFSYGGRRAPWTIKDKLVE